jgi:hypothetical protein
VFFANCVQIFVEVLLFVKPFNAMAPSQDMEKPLFGKNKTTANATVQKSLDKAKTKAKANVEQAMRMLKYGQGRTLVLVKDPQFRTVTISTASGAVVLGTVGGAFGTASGVVFGTAVGAIPALFTFGLSLPIGAVIGGSTGLCIGTATGVGTGAVGGSIAGFAGYKYRIQINNGLVTIKKKALEAQGNTKVAASSAMAKTRTKVVVIVDGVKQRGVAAGKVAMAKANELAKLSRETVATEKFKVTAATATAGAVVSGGAGAVVGTTAGAALGLIPALFTFGLSIPVCAVVGGCVGTASGTAVGAAGGGAIGYGGFAYKKEIRSGADTLVKQLKDRTACAKSQVSSSAAQLNETIKFYSGKGTV